MENQEIRPKVLYIMGAGHSGSTLLDIVLDNHTLIAGVGELKKLYRFGWPDNTDRRCSCGTPRHECPFWSEVYARWSERIGSNAIRDYVVLQNRFERFRPARNLKWIWQEKRKPSAQFSDYCEMTSALYEAIGEISGKSIIVDSSKTPLRAYGQLLGQKVELYLIHLVRDGRGVVWSHMKPKSREKNPEEGRAKDFFPKPSWRTTFDWVQVNLQSHWVISQAKPDRVLRIQYERFVQDPAAYMNQIGAWLSEDLSALGRDLVDKRPLSVSHQVAGNSLRMQRGIVLREDIKWQQSLPVKDRRVFWLLGGWLAKKYGYKASLVR